MIRRVFYVAGPGDVIRAHEHWSQNEQDPSEVSLTYSGQVEDFCRDLGARAYVVSYHQRKEVRRDGPFTLEHRPKPMPGASGLWYYLAELWYGLGLLITAVRFRADLAVIDSGHTFYFMTALYRLFGIRVIPVLVNSLWPNGFPPTRPGPRLVLWLDSFFYRWVPEAILCISPECARQVAQLTSGRHRPLLRFNAQFLPENFDKVPPPPPHDQRPFRVMYIGRVIRYKGVFDILEMARRIEAVAPGQVHWELCGRGVDLEALQARHQELGLEGVVTIRGWVALAEVIEVYTRSHAAIVPTRSGFCEGLAMTAAEAVCAGRPVITNPVVPALEMLTGAVVEAKTDDVDSHVECVLKLASDADEYDRLCRACAGLRGPFHDRSTGLTAVLKQAIDPQAPTAALVRFDRIAKQSESVL